MRKRFSYLLIFIVLFFSADFAVHRILQSGLHKYFGLGETTEIALIGHSHLMLRINKTRLEESLGQQVTKYTSEGVNVSDRKLMIDYLLTHNTQTKVVVYGVDAWMFTGEGLSDNSYKLFLPFMDNPKIKEQIREKAPIEEFWQKRIVRSSRYSEPLINSALRGHLGNWSNYKFGTVDTLHLINNVAEGNFRKINSTAQNRTLFEATLKDLQTKNIQVVLVYVPTISYYNQAEPEKFKEEISYYKNLPLQYNNVQYFEYLEGWESNYSFFFDPIHLNPEGQSAFTTAFSSDLKSLLQ